MDYKKKYLKYKSKYNSIKKLFGGTTIYNEHPPDFPKENTKILRSIVHKQYIEIENCNKELLKFRQIGHINFRINQDILLFIAQLIDKLKGMGNKNLIMDENNIKILTDILKRMRDKITLLYK
tara:strand:+ start:604 stop:972 length:369 start_codon:yes stop_codon:yes gene_type:complete